MIIIGLITYFLGLGWPHLTKAAQYSFHPALKYLAILCDNGEFIPNSRLLSQNFLLLFKQNTKNLQVSDAAFSAKMEELDLSLTNAINKLRIKPKLQ